MIDIQNDFKQIRYSFDNTFNKTLGYKSGWKILTNCKIMQRIYLVFNGGICYDFYPAVYNFLFFLLIGQFFLFLIK